MDCRLRNYFCLHMGMRLSARAKLTLAIVFVIFYMMAAFYWWTVSLTNYSRREKELRIQLYRSDSLHLAGELSHNMFTGRFKGPDSLTFTYRGRSMYVDTTALLGHVLPKYPYYDVRFNPGQPFEKIFSIRIKPSVIEGEMDKFRRKRDSWISEGVVMTIIMLVISIALFLFLDRVLRMNQQQNNFLLAVTHELKTPVASTKLAIQTAQRRPEASEPSMNKLLDMADNNLSRLSRIIDHVLMATRVQSVQVKTVMQDLVVEELVNDTLTEINSSLPATAEIRCRFVPDLVIRGDRDMLQMAISNLLSNAIKYSPPGKEIVEVTTYVHKGKVAMSISDFGPGIPIKERKNIFRMFYRIGDEKTRQSSGTGLGLFLVSRILRQHSAIITVNDNIPCGTTFNIIFKDTASL